MAPLLSTISLWLTLISHNGVSSLVYQHTVFQIHLDPVHDNGTSSVFFSTVSSVQACINKCHNQPSCESLVYETISFKCSLFEGKIVGEGITSNQVYNQVLNKTASGYYCESVKWETIFTWNCWSDKKGHYWTEAYANHLCNGDSSGYFYNESVPVCYKIDTQPRLMDDAVMFCGESEGHLLRIDTEIKQKFVENLNLEATSSISKYRIDGKQMNTIWRFSNDQPITRFYWYPGEPADGVVSIGMRVGYGGKWDDINPNIVHGRNCEKDIQFD